TITYNVLSVNTEGIYVIGANNNTIKSNTLSQSSISLFYSGNSVIGKNNISDSRPDAIRLIGSDNNTVIDNTPSGLSGRITIDGSEKNRIIGNSISTDYGPGIYIEGSGANLVSDNNVSTNLISIFVRNSANVTFLRNMLEEGGLYIEGSMLHQWNTHSIDTSNKVNGRPIYYWKNRTGGTIPPGAGQAIIANCSGVSVENQSFVNGSVGIELSFSSYGTLWNNTFLSNSMEGIYSYASWNNSYSDNIFLSNNKSINLQYSHNNSIFNNVMFDGLRGIELEWSNDNSIFDNNASSNIWSGLFLYRSDFNTITDNFASLNEWGVDLLQSDNNTIEGNIASLNGKYGIILKQSHFNRVYHNEISYNRFQAYDDMDTNQWDNGYPSGGNYWSDYTGDDQFSGPLQNLVGSDGIGDTSHMVFLNTWDRYPLMSPSGPIFPRPPVMLFAELTGGNMENVTLAWWESPDDGSGLKSVVRYEILRNSSYDSSGQGYGLVATVSNGTVRFVDSLAGEGDPSNHF
ncbi:MAG: right-handed parallel beta-helix repeat-containing protein, partial [Thermoplasmata archaeon]|nr:right-handed parallel beta-helix repeat-containing protein [Thermoplasmata archaeon]